MPSPDRRRLTTLVVVMAVLMAAPLAVVASDAFTDVPDSNVHHDDVTWLADNNVTAGCNPPDNTEFCPSEPVLRQQMASFMRRLAENEVVNAATANQADHAATADSASSADDADALDGSAPDAYRTVIEGVRCDSGCEGPGNLTNAPMLELEIEVPAAGVLAFDSSATVEFTNPTNEYVSTWLTLNGDPSSFGGCEPSFLGVPLGESTVEGGQSLVFVDGNVINADLSASPAAEVPAGTHTIRLCGFSSVASSTYASAVTATWSASGSANLPTTSSGSDKEIDDDLRNRLEEATND